jgi:hypothetical protein
MNHYFVSVARGSDSAGTGTATNPWKTIGKAIGAGSAASLGIDGARVYVEPGQYREAVTISGLSPSAATPLEIIGDCDGAGFHAGGHTTPKTGVIEWVAWSDDNTPMALSCLRAIGKTHVTLRGFKMYGGDTTNSCIYLSSAEDWTVSNCTFVPFRTSTSAYLSSINRVVFDGCDFHGPYTTVASTLRFTAALAGAEYSINSAVRNCRFVGGGPVTLGSSGTGAFAATGLTIEHCFASGGVWTFASIYGDIPGVTLATPIVVRACVIVASRGVVAGNVSHVAENYNIFDSATPRTNVTAGANSSTTVRVAVDYADGRFAGVPLRPWGTPTPGSPLVGFVGGGTSPAVDFTGRARPEGLGTVNPSAGAFERHDTGAANATHADAGSAACLAITGPGSLERPILLDAAATTISVKVRWDGNHGDAAKPQAILLANPEIGVTTDQTLTAATAGGTGETPNAYETLTFAPVTPTRAGALMLRLVSRSAAGSGVAYFDSITLA